MHSVPSFEIDLDYPDCTSTSEPVPIKFISRTDQPKQWDPSTILKDSVATVGTSRAESCLRSRVYESSMEDSMINLDVSSSRSRSLREDCSLRRLAPYTLLNERRRMAVLAVVSYDSPCWRPCFRMWVAIEHATAIWTLS